MASSAERSGGNDLPHSQTPYLNVVFVKRILAVNN